MCRIKVTKNHMDHTQQHDQCAKGSPPFQIAAMLCHAFNRLSASSCKLLPPPPNTHTLFACFLHYCCSGMAMGEWSGALELQLKKHFRTEP